MQRPAPASFLFPLLLAVALPFGSHSVLHIPQSMPLPGGQQASLEAGAQGERSLLRRTLFCLTPITVVCTHKVESPRLRRAGFRPNPHGGG